MPDSQLICHSALWAAFGDALGFITEGADRARLVSRTGIPKITTTIPWKRRVGGPYGSSLTLPRGCYSDDTQLRLATSRAIGRNGSFDVEAFAKIELPVWLGYSLGAGLGSTEAAAALRSPRVNWFSNFFKRSRSSYLQGGGNGAAMRIHPHVWSATNKHSPETYVPDVIRNAVCTHGHPRGILGAVFHSMCLAQTIVDRSVPGPAFWKTASSYFPTVAELVRKDPELSSFWLPVWEEKKKGTLGAEILIVAEEINRDIDIIVKGLERRKAYSYEQMVQDVGANLPDCRGSGIKTSLLAVALSWMRRDCDPVKALEDAVNMLESDTDTIATMAGALLGCCAESPPPGEIMDKEYIESEARRMYGLSVSREVNGFTYPDLGVWNPPKNKIDIIGKVENEYVIIGLGSAMPKGKPYRTKVSDDLIWQWFTLDFGQMLLCKRRETVKVFQASAIPPRHSREERTSTVPSSNSASQGQVSLFETRSRSDREKKSTATLDILTQEAIRSGFDPQLIGKHILELSSDPKGIEHVVAYASVIAKAQMARQQEQKRTQTKKKRQT